MTDLQPLVSALTDRLSPFPLQLPITMVVAFSMCIICLLMAGESAPAPRPHAQF